MIESNRIGLGSQRVLAAVGVLLAALMIASSCDRSASTRTALKSQRAAWQARIESLRQRESDMVARLAALPAPKPHAGKSPEMAAHLRVQAEIASSKQSLRNVELYLADEVQAVETMIDRQDDNQVDGTLNQVITQVAGTLDGQERALASAEAALTQLSLAGAQPPKAPARTN